MSRFARAGRSDGDRGSEMRASIKDGVGEVGVYVSSFRVRHLVHHSQEHEWVTLERGIIESRLRVLRFA